MEKITLPSRELAKNANHLTKCGVMEEMEMAKVLILGSGMVARPIVDYLLNHGYDVILASRTISKVKGILKDRPHSKPETLDVKLHPEKLDELIPLSDAVVSLLPPAYHVMVAKKCLEHRKHLVTTSYVKPEMKNLDADAKSKDLLFLNECGLDPGIDHMEAARIIHQVRKKNGKILSFLSYAGALPSPEANTNIFGYKLSWSPRGVLQASTNAARYLKDGTIVEVNGKDLFSHCQRYEIPELGSFEIYPNRDSLPYRELYEIPEVQTLMRGTIRNVGHCETWKAIVDLGLLDESKEFDLKTKTCADLLRQLVNIPKEANLKEIIARRLGLDTNHHVIQKLEWLGFFDERPIGFSKGTTLDVTLKLVEEKLQYASGERDMIILEHTFIVEYPDQQKKEKITSRLIGYGIPNGDSAVARTVALPAAIAVRLLLEGKIKERGVKIPLQPELYDPILDELKSVGISFTTETTEIS